MAERKLSRLTLALAILGIAIASLWVWLTGGTVLASEISSIRPAWVPLLVLATAINICVRFLRWHYLLRRAQVLLPTRRSFSIYLASLAAIITPAYVGEIIRPVLVRRSFGVPIRTTVPVLVAERLCDIAALALIGVVTAGNPLGIAIMSAVVVGVWGLMWLARSSIDAFAPSSYVVSMLMRGRVIGQAMLLSLAAWVPAAMTVTLATSALGEDVSLFSGMGVFVSSTLLGGFSLMPAGVGVTGSVAILRLRDLGLALPASVAAASLVRLSTAGIALAFGAAFLAFELSRRPTLPGPDSVQHFDEIAGEYERQFSPHIWEFLVEKKTAMIAEAIASAPGQRTGLDLGCGHGYHCQALEQSGFKVIGMDPAGDFVSQARRAGANVLRGSGVQMPLRDETLDFVYAIGVLHHLDRDTDRLLAYREIRRVLKPGGLFLLHETNPFNLLFRIYMGYIFPILKSIDEGTEQWIDPRQLEIEGFHLDSVVYSTFLPDFTPAPLIKPLSTVERRLESSRWNIYAAHYLAKFVKT